MKKTAQTVDIVQKENRVLRKVAEEVNFLTTSFAKLQEIIVDMTNALESQDDGVAIAAPQIGLSMRMFVVSKRVFELTKTKYTRNPATGEFEDMVCINPIILKVSKEKKMMEEGCLSVRWLYGQVSRSVKVTLEASDIYGKRFRVGASGLLAQVIQHETDHLNGILFIDTAEDIEEVLPDKNISSENIKKNGKDEKGE